MTDTGRPGPNRWWLIRLPVFVQCLIVGAALALATGAVWGFVRGVQHLPTLPVAIVEGAILVSVFADPFVVVLAGVVALAVTVRRHLRHGD